MSELERPAEITKAPPPPPAPGSAPRFSAEYTTLLAIYHFCGHFKSFKYSFSKFTIAWRVESQARQRLHVCLLTNIWKGPGKQVKNQKRGKCVRSLNSDFSDLFLQFSQSQVKTLCKPKLKNFLRQ
ncbi:unnamed protein product [Oikopleura dioica]|uniref:Uncharacterized protein n=1 Tax=Oikopleura dioica TaxID=34765 RepID=E4X6F0_OIKDI|nr:unnamed protein product [Oikopleura dioica]